MFLNRVFSSKGKIDILRTLSGKKRGMSITEVSNATGITKAGVSKAVRDLVGAGVVTSERIGKMLLLSINIESPIGSAIAELFEWETSVEDELLPTVIDDVLKDYSGKNIVSILLFGSRAKRTAKIGSDVDIMCICRRLKKSKAESRLVKGILVTMFSISKSEFIRKLRQEDPLIVNVVKDSVVQRGADEFNEAIKNAKERI